MFQKLEFCNFLTQETYRIHRCGLGTVGSPWVSVLTSSSSSTVCISSAEWKNHEIITQHLSSYVF